MHTVIINGSPRGTFGNSQIILNKFLEGYSLSGDTYQQFCVSDKEKWVEIKTSIEKSANIIVIFPLYAELLPGSLLEFFDYLSDAELSEQNTMSFILHSGNLVAGVRGCCNDYLKQLTKYLGCSFGGVLIRGNSFFYFNIDSQKAEELVSPYAEMGKYFSINKSFFGEEVRKFVGQTEIKQSEARIINRICKILMTEFAEKANCKIPLDNKPYENL